MTKTVVIGIIAAIALTSALIFGAASVQQEAVGAAAPPEERPVCSDERVSETIDFEDYDLDSGEVLVLLDTTGSGTLCVVHVAANLPCDGGQDGTPANQAPPLDIVAGIAGGALSGVIDAAADDTSFTGTNGSCVYHDTFFAPAPRTITDVIIANFGDDGVELDEVVITITGTYEAERKDLPDEERLK